MFVSGYQGIILKSHPFWRTPFSLAPWLARAEWLQIGPCRGCGAAASPTSSGCCCVCKDWEMSRGKNNPALLLRFLFILPIKCIGRDLRVQLLWKSSVHCKCPVGFVMEKTELWANCFSQVDQIEHWCWWEWKGALYDLRAVAFVIQGDGEENDGCCSKKPWS